MLTSLFKQENAQDVMFWWQKWDEGLDFLDGLRLGNYEKLLLYFQQNRYFCLIEVFLR